MVIWILSIIGVHAIIYMYIGEFYFGDLYRICQIKNFAKVQVHLTEVQVNFWQAGSQVGIKTYD